MNSILAGFILCLVLFDQSHLAAATVNSPCEVQLVNGPSAQSLEHPMTAYGTRASARLEEIRQAVQAIPETERTYFLQILKAVDAAVGKHQGVYLNERRIGKLDIPRHLLILKTIADFEASKPRFSLYKIKRAIEGRYSLQEYIDCIP